MRESLAQISGDDALNPQIDLFDPPLRAHAQPRARQQTEKKGRYQSPRKRLTADMGDLAGLADISSQHQHVAVWHAPRDRPNSLGFPLASIRPDDVGALCRSVDLQMRWQAFEITDDQAAIGGEYRRE